MTAKLIIGDLSRKKMINLSLFLFILLPALLMSNAFSMVFSLSTSLDELFEKAKVPHFVQMHAGEPDRTAIESWNRGREDIRAYQAVLMISVDGSDLFLGDTEEAEAASVMDLCFVRQNRDFDFLLNLDNEVVAPGKGEIAVPLYYRDERGLEPGDAVILKKGIHRMEFIIVSFSRDAQMNPALIHSKRFVVSDEDFDLMRNLFTESEYLLEYRLDDPEQAPAFADAYSNAGLPASGPAVTVNLFRIINAVSDGITITILILLSLLFCITAVLCLRFTLLASLEEDYREIGVMKGIGFPPGFIRTIYLGKYLVMGAASSLAGYGFSFFLYRAMTAHIRQYMGDPSRGLSGIVLPLAGAAIVFLTVILSCLVVLRHFNGISAVQALRAGRVPAGGRGIGFFSLHRFSLPGFNLTLALRDLFIRGRMFLILGLVYLLCSFMILVPLNFSNTISSPDFLSYMGMGRSDIRIDLRPDEDGQKRFEGMIDRLEADADVEALASFTTYRSRIRRSGGESFSLNVQTGDFSVFPQEYLEGRAPLSEGEIALSLLNAKELAVHSGDTLVLGNGGAAVEMRVCGLYQDVTGGGYTAKAFFLPSPGRALWHTVSLNLKNGVYPKEKAEEFSAAFSSARVTDIESYLEQTLGETLSLLRKITVLAAVAAILGSLLITSLFLRMILAKDGSQNAVMRGIGFSRGDIKRQYLFRILLILVFGTAAGTVLARSGGERLVSALWSVMGASEIHFVIAPITSYVLVPATLILLVAGTAQRVMKDGTLIDSLSIRNLNAE